MLSKQKKQIFSYIEGTNMYFCFTYFDCKKTDFLFSEVQLVISSQLLVTQSELHHSYPICSYDTLIIALSKNINQSYDTQFHILLQAQPTWSKVSEKQGKNHFRCLSYTYSQQQSPTMQKPPQSRANSFRFLPHFILNVSLLPSKSCG